MRPAFPVCAALVACLATPVAAKDELRGSYSAFIHYGASYLKQADHATLFAAGNPVPGASFTTEGDLAMSFEAGVFLRDGWAIAAFGTIPTNLSNTGGGVLTALGNLGDESVGYYAATGQYHFNMRGPISPYVGTGIGYMHIFSLTDGAVTDLDIASSWGLVAQAGIDFHLNDRVGLFVDVKRYWLKTQASGSLGGIPITAQATVDPWIVSTGVGVRF